MSKDKNTKPEDLAAETLKAAELEDQVKKLEESKTILEDAVESWKKEAEQAKKDLKKSQELVNSMESELDLSLETIKKLKEEASLDKDVVCKNKMRELWAKIKQQHVQRVNSVTEEMDSCLR